MAQVSYRAGLLASLPAASAGAASPFSTLDPAGPVARIIARLWWIMAGASVAITLGMIALALYCAVHPSRPAALDARKWLLGGGILFPSVVLLALLGGGAYAGWVMAARLAPPPFVVQVQARQWYWEARYPETDRPQARSVNVVHIPAAMPVEFRVSTPDVIHSFWVPRLGGKVDAVPGRINVIRLQADRPGIYRGLCAEFCGAGHAQMMLDVHAHDAARLPDVLAALPEDGAQAQPRQRSGR